MSESSVRSYLKSVLDAVSNVGQVHDYERWALNWSDILDRYKTTISGSDMLRGWTISCVGWEAEYLDYPNDAGSYIEVRRYQYKVRGYFGLNDGDASEKTAAGIVEDVCEALNSNATLHAMQNATDLWGPVPPARVDVFEARSFAGVLCHYAEITQLADEAVAKRIV